MRHAIPSTPGDELADGDKVDLAVFTEYTDFVIGLSTTGINKAVIALFKTTAIRIGENQFNPSDADVLELELKSPPQLQEVSRSCVFGRLYLTFDPGPA